MVSRVRELGLLVAILFLAVPVQAQDFTIDEVMSAPMPSGLVASPAGGAVAWVQTEEGVRNVYLATAPDYQGLQLTAYTEDDGHGLGGLQFTEDGGSIIYSRGGDPNRQGTKPASRQTKNPGSSTGLLPRSRTRPPQNCALPLGSQKRP